jgi:SAM-dependent methyltransferase
MIVGMLDRIAALPRRLRWALQNWSPAKDRGFHDALFGAHSYDPFTFAYPGYLTIRRFAELTEPHLEGIRHAYDLGCGPGEITCELARRNPSVRFTGIDHSAAAIARANQHKAALRLSNVSFDVGDASSHAVDGADAVLMFDSFHHLLDPAGFVRALAPRIRRVVLVEPAGDWLGRWQKTFDVDWIVPVVDGIRARLAWQAGLPVATAAGGDAPLPQPGRPIEHRYTIGDLEHFFEGYGLTVRGTLAGLETYPPNPYVHHPLGEEFGEIAAKTVAAVEEVLCRHDLDLHAKHWVICAERGRTRLRRTVSPPSPTNGEPPAAAAGPYDVEYLACDAPVSARRGATLAVSLTLRNASWRPWRSDTPAAPVSASYHWLDSDGAVAVEDGRRSPFPHTINAGSTCSMTCTVDVPTTPGQYILAFDLVEEGVTWFSRAGAPMLKRGVKVR